MRLNTVRFAVGWWHRITSGKCLLIATSMWLGVEYGVDVRYIDCSWMGLGVNPPDGLALSVDSLCCSASGKGVGNPIHGRAHISGIIKTTVRSTAAISVEFVGPISLRVIYMDSLTYLLIFSHVHQVPKYDYIRLWYVAFLVLFGANTSCWLLNTVRLGLGSIRPRQIDARR
jgi:hypothetical protein